MAPFFSLVHDLNPSKIEWVMKVRLVLIYKVPTFGDSSAIHSLECIFHDNEGSKIHATIKQQHIQKFRTIFKEHHVYAIKDFIVADNLMKFKTTVAKYKIIFVGKTMVTEVFDEKFPWNLYDLKPFEYFSNPDEVEESQLIDVIGKLIARNSPQNKEIAGQQAKMMDIILEDHEGRTLPCTLWGEYVDHLMNYLAATIEEPVIFLMQLCRVRKFKDVVRVSNTFYVSNVLINGDIKDVAEFRSSLTATKKEATENNNLAVPAQAPETKPQTILEEFEGSQEFVRTIEQLNEINEAGNYWVMGRIDFIDSGKNWYYLSCHKCLKKIIPAAGQFYCDKCDCFQSSCKIRYKIQVRVVDNTGNASFLLWDKESAKLIGKSAADLKENTDKKNIPGEIANLVDKNVLFKIQIKPYHSGPIQEVYHVLKVVMDNSVIEKYFGGHNNSQEADIFPKSDVGDIRDLHEPNSSKGEVVTPMKNTRKTSIAPVMKDSKLKRSLLEEFCSSDNDNDKKMKVEVKIEKE